MQKDEIEAIQGQIPNLHNQQLNHNSLEDINKLILALEQKQHNKKKKCTVM